MKIEKVSENQIRCTLTKEDLASRQIHMTELVYGNEKTRALFQDMMQQAYLDCGFEVNNGPLMIEAIPTSSEGIMLLITRVDNPEELDSRFSRFSPETSHTQVTETMGSIGDLIDFFSKLAQGRRDGSSVSAVPGQEGLESVKTSAPDTKGEDQSGNQDQYNLTRFYLFRDLPTVIRAAHAADTFDGVSSLYKNPEEENYYLIMQKAESPAEQFNRVCNVLSEYGLSVEFIPGIEQLFGEHMETILKGRALGDLRSL